MVSYLCKKHILQKMILRNEKKNLEKASFFLLIEKKVFGDVDQFLWDEKS